MRDKNKIIIVLSVLLPTLILVGFLLTRKSYLIRDVPYVNIWTHGDGYMSAAALYDVLAYWNKRDPSLLAPSPEFLADRFPQWEEQHLADFLDYAKSELGYEGALIRANSAKDLRRFLNRTSQTPLIIVRNFSKDVSYRPFAVVIGINPGKSVVLHDYYLGQAYT
ncbi:MAG: hypothetical protein HYS57_00335, partial [Parcubacteria group bacterium]|nr:hypothetical protein [Parcubacteria group bacterium]